MNNNYFHQQAKLPRDIFDMMIFLEKNTSLEQIMDTFIAYLSQGNRPFSDMLNPRLLDIEDTYEKSFIGMAEINAPLKTLIQIRKTVIKELKRILTTKHKKFLVSMMNNTPD